MKRVTIPLYPLNYEYRIVFINNIRSVPGMFQSFHRVYLFNSICITVRHGNNINKHSPFFQLSMTYDLEMSLSKRVIVETLSSYFPYEFLRIEQKSGILYVFIRTDGAGLMLLCLKSSPGDEVSR